MKVVVFGSGGQLGRELARAPLAHGIELVLRSRAQQDIADPAGVNALFDEHRPAFVINAAAYTAVDAAESNQSAALRANRDGPAVLARACAAYDAALVHVSTDYVFEGSSSEAYAEEHDVNPLNVYGASKLSGEQAVREELARHLIVRASWVYGALGQNFVTAMLKLGRERERVSVVADQWGRPTAAKELAAALLRMVGACASAERADGSAPWGTYHFADQGQTNRFELASYVIALQAEARGRGAKVEPIDTSAYPLPARRPMRAVLDTSKIERTFGIAPRPWRDAVADVVRELLATS